MDQGITTSLLNLQIDSQNEGGLAASRSQEQEEMLSNDDLPVSQMSECERVSTFGEPLDTEPSFPLFRKLPAELRIRIWYLTLRPRIVDVTVKYQWEWLEDTETEQYVTEIGLFGQKEFGKGHLLTCHESRQVFLEHYERLQLLPNIRGIKSSTYWGYVDYHRDTLVVLPELLLNNEVSDPRDLLDTSKMEKVAIHQELWMIPDTDRPPPDQNRWDILFAAVRSRCPRLKDLSILKGIPGLGFKHEAPQAESDWELVDTRDFRYLDINQHPYGLCRYCRNEEDIRDHYEIHRQSIRRFRSGIQHWIDMVADRAVAAENAFGRYIKHHEGEYENVRFSFAAVCAEIKRRQINSPCRVLPSPYEDVTEYWRYADGNEDRGHCLFIPVFSMSADFGIFVHENNKVLISMYDGIKDLFAETGSVEEIGE